MGAVATRHPAIAEENATMPEMEMRWAMLNAKVVFKRQGLYGSFCLDAPVCLF